jgi:hypothetical protein
MASITLVNDTENNEVVHVAIYWRPTANPTLDTYAWRIVEPPPSGGETVVNIPDEFEVYANYPSEGDDRNDPTAGNRTPVLSFAELTARFIVTSVTTQDSAASAATITQVFTGLVLNEVRIENQFSSGVWTHITKDGADIYAPAVVAPGEVRMADIRSRLSLAVVAGSGPDGSAVDEEVQTTETPILDGQTATVTGSVWKGYAITVS